jgi:hypothetical protein
MTPEQFQRVGDLYHAAMELAPAARPSFLAQVCSGEDESDTLGEAGGLKGSAASKAAN